MLELARLDILDLWNALQAGSIITLAALTGREVIETAHLATERAFAFNLLVGLRHDESGDVVGNGRVSERFMSLLKKRVSRDGRYARGRGLKVVRQEDEERWKKANYICWRETRADSDVSNRRHSAAKTTAGATTLLVQQERSQVNE